MLELVLRSFRNGYAVRPEFAIISSFSCTIFSDIVCCLLSEWCVLTSFYQSLQAMSFFYAVFNLRNLLYIIARHNGYPSGSQTADRLRIYLASVYTNRPHRPQIGQCGLCSSLCVNPMFYPMSASALRRPESWNLWQTKHYRTRGTQACLPFPAAAPHASIVFSCRSFPAGSRPARGRD